MCSGNICRSPMAEVVLRHEASAIGLAGRLAIDSAGTAADVGFEIDRRAHQGIGTTRLRAPQPSGAPVPTRLAQ